MGPGGYAFTSNRAKKVEVDWVKLGLVTTVKEEELGKEVTTNDQLFKDKSEEAEQEYNRSLSANPYLANTLKLLPSKYIELEGVGAIISRGKSHTLQLDPSFENRRILLYETNQVLDP